MEIKLYKLYYTKKAVKNVENLKYAKLDVKTECLCNLLQSNPLPPNSKKLSGDLKGKYSIRINLKHRLIYEIFEEEKAIKILSLWNHYDDN